MNPQISVVIATRNRGQLVARLVEQLDAQTIDRTAFEVIVVDDGSEEPVGEMLAELSVRVPLRTLRIAWSGQGAARHQGAEAARGEILVFLDDDMQVAPGFLAAQLARHRAVARSVVLGHIRPAPGLGRMPLFERYHARQLERWREGIRAGRIQPRGVHLCTGNVSMPRREYFAVGGFNASLKRSEDRELGIRLEKHGCHFVFAEEVESIHCSDHADLSVWRRRAYLYGRFDRIIYGMHADMPMADPWRFWSLIHPLSRPIVALSLVWPALGRMVGRSSYGLAVLVDRVGAGRPALTLVALAYALEYFAGLSDECGSFRALSKSIPAAETGVRAAFRHMRAAIRADHDMSLHYRRKYHGETTRSSLLGDLVRKVGFQMLFAYRIMRFFDACRIPVLPQLASRLIRHAYGAEIHWKTRIAPGVSIVHGVGLVLSHAAEVGEGCILFHNVTLGENVNMTTGLVGAPRLGRNVHVGPGATLLGPIEVGESSKIAAGVVLMRTVSPASRVTPAEPVVRSRWSAPVLPLRQQAV